MAPGLDGAPFPASWVAAPVVYDIIYNPPETRLLREARARGARTIGGLEMFVGQAEAQFRLFTGQDPPPGLMRATLLAAIAGARGASAPPAPVPAPPPGARRRR
jgi:shikimate 5-dehydrogenase